MGPTPGLGQGELSIEPPFLGSARLEISFTETPREEAESAFRGPKPSAEESLEASPPGLQLPIALLPSATASEFLTRP